ncbi:MAG: HlyC/CorC family transporter [Chloroflexi bacterium]|nr:HlyC/CorC family transporter [Chloroflexota bacterium]
MDEPGLWVSLALFALSSLFAAYVSAAQATLHWLNRGRLWQLLPEGAAGARPAQRVVEQPGALLATGLVVRTLALAGAGASGLLVVLDQWSAAPWAGVAAALLLLLALVLLQLLGQALALSRPERSATLVVGPLRVLGLLLWPLVALPTAVQRLALRALGLSEAAEPTEAEEELRLLVEAAKENGGLEAEEREMIHGIVELSQRPVREIMVPRIDVVALDQRATVREALDRITASGHSRLPLYDGSVDNVVGIVVAKDLLKHLSTGSLDSPVEPLARPAYFVPETKKIDELLRELRQQRVQMAIVVDEYGGTAGLITVEDMVEEIVGEIRDEYDVEEALFERVSEHEAIFDARMNVRDVGDVLNINLEGELEEHEYDTLGGLVYERLGRVPAEGDEVQVNGCLISVLATEGHRIKKVKVTVGAEPEQADEQADD